MYCPKCGAHIPDGSHFCFRCGAKVDEAPQIPQQPYGLPPYGQAGKPPYYQMQYGHPPKNASAKTALMIAGGAVLLIGIAAVLIFGVLKIGGNSTLRPTEASNDISSHTEASSGTSSHAETDAIKVKLVGLSLPTELLERWRVDGAYISAALGEMGYEVDLQYANSDAATQVMQIKNQIVKGCDVLVIASVDYSALDRVLAETREAGITVIAFDSLLTDTDNCDYYVTYSLHNTGMTQGRYIVDALGLSKGAKGPFTMECFGGDLLSNNAWLFYEGAMEVLQPYIDSGALKVKSGQTDMSDMAIAAWDPAASEERMDILLKAFYRNDNIDAILSPNDSIAKGIVASLKKDGYGSADKPYPILTGQDCDLINVGQIIRGEQSMSIFADTRVLADQVITTVDAILSGKRVPVNDEYYNGVKYVPAFSCEVRIVDASNWREMLIEPGYYFESDIPME